MSLVSGLAVALTTFFPASRLVELIGKANCEVDVVQSGIEPDESGQLVSTILNCFGTIVGGAAGILLGIIAALPALLAGMVSSIVLELTNNATVRFKIHLWSEIVLGRA